MEIWPWTVERIFTMSCLDNFASLQSERKTESSLSNKFRGVSNSATLPPSMTSMRS